MDICRQRAINRTRRAFRVRKKISGTEQKPRLTVSRSIKHTSAQIIDDTKGITLVHVGTFTKEITNESINKSDKAKIVGELLAQKAKSLGINTVVFDRNGYPFHGRIKALAEGARSKGLEF